MPEPAAEPIQTAPAPEALLGKHRWQIIVKPAAMRLLLRSKELAGELMEPYEVEVFSSFFVQLLQEHSVPCPVSTVYSTTKNYSSKQGAVLHWRWGKTRDDQPTVSVFASTRVDQSQHGLEGGGI